MKEQLIFVAYSIGTDVSIISPEVALDNLEEWDSMGTIAIIAMLDKKYGIQLNAEQISSLKTVKDILNYMQDK